MGEHIIVTGLENGYGKRHLQETYLVTQLRSEDGAPGLGGRGLDDAGWLGEVLGTSRACSPQ